MHKMSTTLHKTPFCLLNLHKRTNLVLYNFRLCFSGLAGHITLFQIIAPFFVRKMVQVAPEIRPKAYSQNVAFFVFKMLHDVSFFRWKASRHKG
jgi:hypothetical protein